MKYVVQVKYTNPAHEHVSLRRRVDTVNRIVEAANEAEAINRVTRQQKALGFLVKESAVVNTGAVEQSLAAGAVDKKKKKVVGDDNEETEIKKEPVKEAVKSGNEGRGYHGEHDAEVADKKYAEAHANVMKVVGNASSKMVKDYLDSRHGRHLVGREGNHEHIRTDFDKFKKEYNPKMFEEVEQIEEDRPMSAPAYSSVSAKILTGKTGTNFGYAPNKMPPHLKAAQAKSDELSKVVKRPQAGTLAAMKKEENEVDNKKVKGRKAAERMVNLAKGKTNQINLEPSVDVHKVPGVIGAMK